MVVFKKIPIHFLYIYLLAFALEVGEVRNSNWSIFLPIIVHSLILFIRQITSRGDIEGVR